MDIARAKKKIGKTVMYSRHKEGSSRSEVSWGIVRSVHWDDRFHSIKFTLQDTKYNDEVEVWEHNIRT